MDAEIAAAFVEESKNRATNARESCRGPYFSEIDRR